MNKIFCIGLNKTGTTSLHRAFLLLGIPSVHFECGRGNIKKIFKANFENGLPILTGLEEFRAFSDWNGPTTNLIFRELDQQYPGSKFILNTRNVEAWIESREKHVLRKPDLEEARLANPGSTWLSIDKAAWRNEWDELHSEAYAYFSERPDDLLVMDVTAGDGWEKLCPFLGMSIPDSPFPLANSAKSARPRSVLARIRDSLPFQFMRGSGTRRAEKRR